MDYDFNYAQPPADRRLVGAGASVGAFVPFVSVGLSGAGFLLPVDPGLPDVAGGGTLVDIKEWRAAEPGRAALDLLLRFSGREAAPTQPMPTLPEQIVLSFTPDIFWIDWGYVNADLAMLYGWTLSGEI